MPNQARQVRRQLKRPSNKVVRKMGKGRNMESEQWFIGKNVNRKTFYVAEHDAKENTTMWTPNRRESISFHTERAAHKYISRYLHDRNDVILITLQTK
jgi:hypothetical protein